MATPKTRPSQAKANKKYFEKNKEVIYKQHAEYYKLHCDAIKTKKKALYKAKKERELLERGGIPKPRKPRTKKKKPIAGRPAVEEIIAVNDK